MPPMDYPDAMAWIQRLKRGKTDRVLMPFLQPGLSLTGYTNGTATGSGSTLAFTGIGKALVEGQFFSLVIGGRRRSEEHTSELQSLMRISYAVFCLKKKNSYSISSLLFCLLFFLLF